MIRTSSIFPKGFFTEESTRRTPKEQGSKGFNSNISYILLVITELLAPTSHKSIVREVIQLNFNHRIPTIFLLSRYGGFYPKLLLPIFNESISDMLREGKIKCASVGVSRHLVKETNNFRKGAIIKIKVTTIK